MLKIGFCFSKTTFQISGAGSNKFNLMNPIFMNPRVPMIPTFEPPCDFVTDTREFSYLREVFKKLLAQRGTNQSF